LRRGSPWEVTRARCRADALTTRADRSRLTSRRFRRSGQPSCAGGTRMSAAMADEALCPLRVPGRRSEGVRRRSVTQVGAHLRPPLGGLRAACIARGTGGSLELCMPSIFGSLRRRRRWRPHFARGSSHSGP
jgi:hypothetical protein